MRRASAAALLLALVAAVAIRRRAREWAEWDAEAPEVNEPDEDRIVPMAAWNGTPVRWPYRGEVS